MNVREEEIPHGEKKAKEEKCREGARYEETVEGISKCRLYTYSRALPKDPVGGTDQL
jgi:hypothetical protein